MSKSQETELLVRGRSLPLCHCTRLGGIQQELSLLHHKPQQGDRCRMEVTLLCFNKACSWEGAGVLGGHAESVLPLSLKRWRCLLTAQYLTKVMVLGRYSGEIWDLRKWLLAGCKEEWAQWRQLVGQEMFQLVIIPVDHSICWLWWASQGESRIPGEEDEWMRNKWIISRWLPGMT